MDPEFIFDEAFEERKLMVNQIVNEINKPVREIRIVRSFMRACLFEFQNRIKHRIIKPVKIKIEPVEEEIEDVEPVVQIPEVITKDIIKDKFTNQSLASVVIGDSYVLKQPDINDSDFEVFLKVKNKKPRNMEKAWKLILKYSDKYNAKGHETNIKYYVVNHLFGFGKLEPFLHDNEVTKVICSGDEYIKVIFQDKELKTNLSFRSDELSDFITNLAGIVKTKLNNFEVELRGFKFIVNSKGNKSLIVERKTKPLNL